MVVAQVTTEAGPIGLLFPVGMALLVASLLYVMEPPVNRRVVLSIVPWMVAGAGAHAMYTIDRFPEIFEVFFDPIAVYFTTFVAAGMVWAMMTTASKLADETPRDAQYVAAAGTGAALSVLMVVFTRAQPSEALLPAFAGLIVAAVVASTVYLLLTVLHTTTLVQTGLLGLVVVFGHTLDATLTAVGVDILGRPSGTEVDRVLAGLAADLPVAETIGTGWLLVLVQVTIAAVIVVAIAVLLERAGTSDRESFGHVALGLVAAVGLGPGVHTFLSLVVIG